MTRIFRITLPLFLSLLASLTACKHTEPVPGGSAGAPFEGIRWQMAAFELDPAVDLDNDGVPDKDLMAFLRPCDRDDTLVFEKGGTFSGDNGQLLCGDETTMGKPGTWAYDQSTKRIRFVDGDGVTAEWTVLEASAKTLKVRSTVTEEGMTLNTIITWKAV